MLCAVSFSSSVWAQTDYTDKIQNSQITGQTSKTEMPSGWTAGDRKTGNSNYTENTGDTQLEAWSNTTMYFDYYQDITGLPAGAYVLSAKCHDTATAGGYLYASTDEGTTRNLTYMTTDYSTIEVAIEVTEGQTLRIGIAADQGTNASWITGDDFKLAYYEEGSLDVTPIYLKNARFSGEGANNATSIEGWTLSNCVLNDWTLSSARVVENYAASNAAFTAMSVTQDVTLPAGYYMVSCEFTARNNTGVLKVLNGENVVGSAKVTSGKETLTQTGCVTLHLTEETALNIGAYADAVAARNNTVWVGVDNFKIEKIGDVTDNDVTALISAIPSDKMMADVKQNLETAKNALESEKNKTNFLALIEAIDDTYPSIIKYNSLAEILSKMKALTETTNFYTTDAYNNYYGTWQSKYDNCTLTTEEASGLLDPRGCVSNWGARVPYVNSVATLYGSFTNAEVNTWSWEGESNHDGSGFVVPYFQDFASTDTTTLTANDVASTLTGLDASTDYAVTAWVRLYMTDGNVKNADITMQLGEGDKVTVAGDQIGTSNYYLGHYTARGTTDADGSITLKFTIGENTKAGWLAFRNIVITKVSDLVEKTVPSSTYGTVCVPYAAVPEEGVTLYEVSGMNSENAITLEEASLPTVAGKPYIYNGTASEKVLFVKADNVSNVTEPIAGENNLTGVFESKAAEESSTSYVLYQGVWHTIGTNVTFGAYSAYLSALPTTESSSAKTIGIYQDTADAIETVNSDNALENANSARYNLAGQRVDKSYKGIVLMNGKKYLAR